MPRRRESPSDDYPFLFLGAGFGTSYKCLECQICFARPPSSDERAAIEALLPPALTYVKSWAPSVLNFGSDDNLEGRVTEGRSRKPTKAEWEAFCADVERRMRDVHKVCPIELFVKHDGGEYGRKLGPWHTGSLRVIAERFHELSLSSFEIGPGVVAVCLSVLGFLAQSQQAMAWLEPAARTKLVEWGTQVASVAPEWPGGKIVDRILDFLPEGEPVTPELASALFCRPTQKLVQRLGSKDLVDRGLALLSSATAENAEQVLETLMSWMILDDAAGRRIGEALLSSAEPLKSAMDERSASVREGFARGRPTGKRSPSIVFASCAGYLLETHQPVPALENVQLGLRFAHPFRELYGLYVRALQGAGHAARAEELAKSDLVQKEIGPAEPRVFYHVARYYADLGRVDEGIEQLRRCLAHDRPRAGLLRSDPRLRKLHGSAFDALFAIRP